MYPQLVSLLIYSRITISPCSLQGHAGALGDGFPWPRGENQASRSRVDVGGTKEDLVINGIVEGSELMMLRPEGVN